MKYPDYFATWWRENLFSLKTTGRKSGDYTIQRCEVEMLVGPPSEMPTMFLDLQMGARIYADDEATTFVNLGEKDKEWYKKGMEYTDDLEAVPDYTKPPQEEKKEPVKLPPLDLE
jgi:hypothetical protein